MFSISPSTNAINASVVCHPSLLKVPDDVEKYLATSRPHSSLIHALMTLNSLSSPRQRLTKYSVMANSSPITSANTLKVALMALQCAGIRASRRLRPGKKVRSKPPYNGSCGTCEE